MLMFLVCSMHFLTDNTGVRTYTVVGTAHKMHRACLIARKDEISRLQRITCRQFDTAYRISLNYTYIHGRLTTVDPGKTTDEMQMRMRRFKIESNRVGVECMLSAVRADDYRNTNVTRATGSQQPKPSVTAERPMVQVAETPVGTMQGCPSERADTSMAAGAMHLLP